MLKSKNGTEKNKRLIAIYPGRFQLPHRGHLSVYKRLCEDFDEVYITTSNKTNDTDSPFTFEEKKELLVALGVPADKVVQCVKPYTPDEIYDDLDVMETIVVVAVGEKDADRFGNREGGYFLPFETVEKMQAVNRQAYIMIIPDLQFFIGGDCVNSASQLREMYAIMDIDSEKEFFINELYDFSNDNTKEILDKLCITTLEKAN